MAAFSATDLRHRLPRLVRDWAPLISILFLYDFLRGFADGLLFHARRAAADPARGGALRQADPDRLAAEPPLARRRPPALVGLRVVRHLPDALRRDPLIAARALDVRARPVRALRVDGLRARADRLRDLRALPGGAAVAGGRRTARSARRPARSASSGAQIPIAHFSSLFEKGQHYANNVAAMPSLHAAYALLATLSSGGSSRAGRACCSRSTRWRWRSRWSTPASTTSSTASPAGSTRSSPTVS